MNKFVIIWIQINCNALQLGLGESSLDHRRRENFPPFFLSEKHWVGGVLERNYGI